MDLLSTRVLVCVQLSLIILCALEESLEVRLYSFTLAPLTVTVRERREHLWFRGNLDHLCRRL